mmetsp:Transcript_19967/g.27929  ORF Transcript_19967/g.27929 Transcript_19967/m.27929 type:complete len:273 (-) Transcript_19967:123-941(-)
MNTIQLPPLSSLLEPQYLYSAPQPQQTLPPFLRFPVSLMVPSNLTFQNMQPQKHSITLDPSPILVVSDKDLQKNNTQCDFSSDESLSSSDIEDSRPSKAHVVEEAKIFANFVESLSATPSVTMSARINKVKKEKSNEPAHAPGSPSAPSSPHTPSTTASPTAPSSPTTTKLPANFCPKFKTKRSRSNKGIFEGQWMEHYNQLKEFKKQQGHTNVTRNTPGWGFLGNWVADQRRKLRRGKLTEKQFTLLCEMDFEWDRTYYFQPTVYGEKPAM